MRIALDASRVKFEDLNKISVNAIFNDDYVKEQCRDDISSRHKYKNSKSLMYKGAFLDNQLAGLFYCEYVTPLELEVHIFFLKECAVYARHLCDEFVKWAFENNVFRITTYVADYRRTIVNMLLKIGFQYEGLMRKCVIRDGIWYNKHVLGITRS